MSADNFNLTNFQIEQQLLVTFDKFSPNQDELFFILINVSRKVHYFINFVLIKI